MNKIIAQMIVCNEENNLPKFFESIDKHIDKIIIIDDASTDSTYEICKKYPKAIVYHNKINMFNINESQLRDQLWKYTKKEANNGDWIISIDADERIMTNKNLRSYINSKYDWVEFKLCDMWSEYEYRIDGLWSPPIRRFFKYKDVNFGLSGIIHSGCVPISIYLSKFGTADLEIKLLHYSYDTIEKRQKKYDYYINKTKSFGPNDTNYKHALTILKNARLCNIYADYPKILVGSLIKNRDWCLGKFLNGIENLDYPKNLISFYFIVNDSTDNSLNILNDFKNNLKEYNGIEIEIINFNTHSEEHKWNSDILKNMAFMRNKLLEKLYNSDCEYLFTIDSDIFLSDTQMLKHLINLKKQVISPVFWARWGDEKTKKALPNVWERGGYDISETTIKNLKYSRIIKVGGLGACTLIHRSITNNPNINYNRVENLPSDMNGEDRDFCNRCSVEGIDMFATTYHTLIHMEKPPAKTYYPLSYYFNLMDKVNNKKCIFYLNGTNQYKINSNYKIYSGDMKMLLEKSKEYDWILILKSNETICDDVNNFLNNLTEFDFLAYTLPIFKTNHQNFYKDCTFEPRIFHSICFKNNLIDFENDEIKCDKIDQSISIAFGKIKQIDIHPDWKDGFLLMDDNSISLNVIVKNEAVALLDMLKQVSPICTEIVANDTGSTDNTVNILKEYNAKIITDNWKDDFSYHRNLCLENSSCKWILRLDADEGLLEQDDIISIWLLTCNQAADCYIFKIKNFMEHPSPKAKFFYSQTIRLFKNNKKIRFNRIVHEEIDESIGKCKYRTVLSPIELAHYGYLKGNEKCEKKFDYYYKLLLKQLEKTPNDFYIWHLLAVHYQHIGKIKESKEHYLKSIELKENAFLSMAGLAEVYEKEKDLENALIWYQKALDCNNPLKFQDVIKHLIQDIVRIKTILEMSKSNKQVSSIG